MKPTLIRAGLDWLEVSYSGALNGEVAQTLDRLKELAQQKDTPQPFDLFPDTAFVQSRAFGFYTYLLKHP